jgi:hypothetical protein
VAQREPAHPHRHERRRLDPRRDGRLVLRPRLPAKSILAALEIGEFYASTGVELEDFGPASVKVKEKNLAHYRIQFIGAQGRVLQETAGTSASYAMKGDEGYVRAKVIDSNGRYAWTQPTFTKR